MGSKLHSGNVAKESTDSNRTGMALRWVGVRPDVHRRQQAQLAVYRKKCLHAGKSLAVWKSDKFGKVWNKTAAAAGPDKMEAAAAAEKKRKTTAAATEKKTAAAADTEKNKAAAAASDIFCLIAEAGEADTVARVIAQAATKAAEKAEKDARYEADVAAEEAANWSEHLAAEAARRRRNATCRWRGSTLDERLREAHQYRLVVGDVSSHFGDAE